MLSDAPTWSHPAGIQKEAAHLRRLSQDADGEGPGHRPDRHARSLACADDDRGRQSRGGHLLPEADQRGCSRRPGDARRRTQIQARGADRHAAPQHAAPGGGAGTIIKEGKLGKIGLVEIYCYYHMRATGNPPDTAPPANLDYEMWTGPAPMRPYNSLVHPRGWRAFMEYGNGIVGDMCVHMLDMARWMLDLGLAQAAHFDGRHSRGQSQQGQHHRYPDRHIRLRGPQDGLAASHLGRRDRSEISLGRYLLRRQGDAQGKRDGIRFHPAGKGTTGPQRRNVRARAVSGRQDREGSGKARAPRPSATT